MFGNVAKDVPSSVFEHILDSIKKAKKVKQDTDLNAADLKKVVEQYKKAYKKALKEDFPQDPADQLQAAIDAAND